MRLAATLCTVSSSKFGQTFRFHICRLNGICRGHQVKSLNLLVVGLVQSEPLKNDPSSRRLLHRAEGVSWPIGALFHSPPALPLLRSCVMPAGSHDGYFSDIADEEQYTGGVDICGTRDIVGNAIIGTLLFLVWQAACFRLSSMLVMVVPGPSIVLTTT